MKRFAALWVAVLVLAAVLALMQFKVECAYDDGVYDARGNGSIVFGACWLPKSGGGWS